MFIHTRLREKLVAKRNLFLFECASFLWQRQFRALWRALEVHAVKFLKSQVILVNEN